MWTGGSPLLSELPRLLGVPHLRVNMPLPIDYLVRIPYNTLFAPQILHKVWSSNTLGKT